MREAQAAIATLRKSSSEEFPAFEPHPWLRGAHAQTIMGRYLGPRGLRLDSTRHEIPLEDGDRLVVHESIPRQWRAGDPATVLVHGLSGCACASYIVRLGVRLASLGIRVVRMNLRGAGEGFGKARKIYHAGRSEDLRAVVSWLAGRIAGSPIALVGFSLGASLALKLAAEAAAAPVAGLDCILAANPPIDLMACTQAMRRPENRVYDRNFVRWLRGEVKRLHQVFPELGEVNLRHVRSVYDFDDAYTAVRNGFDSAEDYYVRNSTLPRIAEVTLPGLVVHAADDPFVPAESFRRATFPGNLRFELTRHGGHLGYISRSRWLGDRRWLDARLAAWLIARWELSCVDNAHDAPSRTKGRPTLGAWNHHA